MNHAITRDDGIVGRLRTQAVRHIRVIKYGIVGVLGILLNLVVLALLLRFFSPQSWVPPALANVLSTIVNFLLHNMWTFSDRAHQGVRMIRGFVLYVAACALGIFLSTVAYVELLHFAGHFPVLAAHLGQHLIPLACQFVAIFLGAAVNYMLNMQFTWPQAETNKTAPTQAQEI